MLSYFPLSFKCLYFYSFYITNTVPNLAKPCRYQFNSSVVSTSLWPYGLQHSRLPCLSSTPRACSNSCPLSATKSNHLVLCHIHLILSSIFLSIRVFSSESALRMRWPKDWSFSFNISSSSEYSGFNSFVIDWFDHLAVQGTLKNLLQHHNVKA